MSNPYANETDAELIDHARAVINGMKANGYEGIIWDEVIARFQNMLNLARPEAGRIDEDKLLRLITNKTMVGAATANEIIMESKR